MVRAAAKNFRDVLIVVDPARLRRSAAAARLAGGTVARVPVRARAGRRSRTPVSATSRSRPRCRTSRRATTALVRNGHRLAGTPPELPGIDVRLSKLRDLRYGENPHQQAALYARPRGRLRPWDILQGKELSYTNLLDLDAAVRVALEFAEPAAVVIKHTNPCGAATGADARRCIRARARCRQPRRLRRHRRAQSRDRCRGRREQSRRPSSKRSSRRRSTRRRGRFWRRRPTCGSSSPTSRRSPRVRPDRPIGSCVRRSPASSYRSAIAWLKRQSRGPSIGSPMDFGW